MLEVAVHVNVELIGTFVAPFEGEGFEGAEGDGHVPVVKFHTGPAEELLQVFLATIFQ